MLLECDRLIVQQNRGLLGAAARGGACTIFDRSGRQIGEVQPERTQVSWSLARPFDLGNLHTRTLALHDEMGALVLRIAIPSNILKSRIEVFSANGVPIGTVRQRQFLRKGDFDIESAGKPLGVIEAQSNRGWEFRIADPEGLEVGRISKVMRGGIREVVAPKRDYELTFAREVPRELRLLCLAAAVCVQAVMTYDALDELARATE